MQRPVFHYAPAQNWMNDPNGLIHFAGEYHLYYQHNPFGRKWGHMSWGHAVSTDLRHWTEQRVAIPEDRSTGRMIFSGTAVVDRDNRSGMQRGETPPLVALFTGRTAGPPEHQSIDLAVSYDGGYRFRQFARNPVIDIGERKFGDPKVFWHEESQSYVLLAIAGYDQGTLQLYRSDDLVHWHRGDEIVVPARPAGFWECPDMFYLPGTGDSGGRWVVKLNYVSTRDDGEALQRHTSYFLAEFTGTSLADLRPLDGPDDDATLLASGSFHTDDAYAELCWSYADADPGRVVQMAWIVQEPHPERPWTGVQSIPRELSIVEHGGAVELHREPASEILEYLAGSSSRRRVPTGTSELKYDEGATAHLIEFGVRSSFDLTVEYADGTQLALRGAEDGIVLQESRHGRRFKVRAHRPVARGTARLFLDGSVVEFFYGGRSLAVDMSTVSVPRRFFGTVPVELSTVSGAGGPD